MHNRPDTDQLFAGFICFLIYSRCRFSHALDMRELVFPTNLEEGFISAELVRTKNSITLERKIRLLRVRAPARGVGDQAWAPCWQALHERHGLAEGEGKPLMPAPRIGGWSSLPITCSWACSWLPDLLFLLPSFDRGSVVGTHSCKRTTLTWCSTFGMERASRSLLGYHTNKATVTLRTTRWISLRFLKKTFEESPTTLVEATTRSTPSRPRLNYVKSSNKKNDLKEVTAIDNSNTEKYSYTIFSRGGKH